MNAVVAALQGTERDTGLDLDQLQYLTDYWEDVRKRYDSFEAGIKSPATDIYRYEIPGGQYTNLKPQVESLGLGEPVQGGQGELPGGQRDAGRHREGDALLQDGGRPGHLHDPERPDPREHRGKGREPGLPRQRRQLLLRHDGPARLAASPRICSGWSSRARSPSPAGPASCCQPVDFEAEERRR